MVQKNVHGLFREKIGDLFGPLDDHDAVPVKILIHAHVVQVRAIVLAHDEELIGRTVEAAAEAMKESRG